MKRGLAVAHIVAELRENGLTSYAIRLAVENRVSNLKLKELIKTYVGH